MNQTTRNALLAMQAAVTDCLNEETPIGDQSQHVEEVSVTTRDDEYCIRMWSDFEDPPETVRDGVNALRVMQLIANHIVPTAVMRFVTGRLQSLGYVDEKETQ